MSNELNGVANWLYGRLSNDPDGVSASGQPYKGLNTLVGGRVYEMMVPEDGGYPCVLFAHMDGRDVVGTGGRRVAVWAYYQIKTIGKGNSFAPLEAISTRLEKLLHQAQDVDDPVVIGCSRTKPLQAVEVTDNVRFNHLGGEFQVFAYDQSGE